MAIKTVLLGGTDWSDGNILYAADQNDTINASAKGGLLGEVKMFALSVSGAITKATLQGYGWAICDGTDIVTTQGITSADITGNAPDMQHQFIRMSNDETSGTASSSAHTHDDGSYATVDDDVGLGQSADVSGNSGSSDAGDFADGYDLVFFIKVKLT